MANCLKMQNRWFFLLLICFSAVIHPGFAQKKVKYKDIFALLNTKQYEAAEPFLKDYLRENTDNPNAFLYMGMIFQDKAGKDDVLRKTTLAIAHMDSAIYFYSRANQTITEKEIKRNDEYYQAYTRRDLRTGEYGIKLSDIQFDMEKRIESMRERIDRIKMISHYFLLSDSMYRKAASLYRKISAPYENDRQLYLRADENTVKDLSALILTYDSCQKFFEQYKASVATVGRIGYNQVLSPQPIKSLREDGRGGADFHNDEVRVWDYRKFGNEARDAILNDIFPTREHLITYDIEINKLREKLRTDSVSVKNDLTKLVNRLLLEKLTRYDERPLPMDVFNVKIADLEYRSTQLEHKPHKDSLDVHLRLANAKRELRSITRLDSLTGVLVKRDIDNDLLNYNHFVANTYNNGDVLRSFIKVSKEFSARELNDCRTRVASIEKSMNWIVLNKTDSIPLSAGLGGRRYRLLSVVPEKFTAGLSYADTTKVAGYFFSITPSRNPDIRISIPVEKKSFPPSDASLARSLTWSDPSGQIFFVLFFSERPNGEKKYPATLAKIYRSDGLAWSQNLSLGFMPREMLFRQENGEFSIRADAAETVVDKNGKVLR